MILVLNIIDLDLNLVTKLASPIEVYLGRTLNINNELTTTQHDQLL